MGKRCCVINCSNRSELNNNKRYFIIPSVITKQDLRTEELTTERRQKWIQIINRKDWTPSPHSFVCSDHFLSGCPSKLHEFRKPDWVPSQKMGYDVDVGPIIGSKRPKKEPQKKQLNILKEKKEWFPTNIKDCDFKVLTDMLKQGKVTNQVLENCDFFYTCKSCRNIYIEFDKFMRHYEVCNPLVRAKQPKFKVTGFDEFTRHYKVCNPPLRSKRMLPDLENFQTSDSETEMMAETASLNCTVNDDHLEKEESLRVKMEPEESDDQNEDAELANEGTVSEASHQTAKNKKFIMMIDDDKFICVKCDVKIESVADIEDHVTKFHSKVVRCNLCEYRCDSIVKLDDHLFQSHSGGVKSKVDDLSGGAASGEWASPGPSGEIKAEESKSTDSDSESDSEENEIDALLLSSENERSAAEKLQTNGKEFYYVTLTEEQEKMVDSKNLMCLWCRKRFTQTCDLRRHLAISHLGYGEFKCKLCNKYSSNSIPNCNVHLKKVHNERDSFIRFRRHFMRLCFVQSMAKS